MGEILDRYEAALEPERRRVAGDQVLARLLSPACDAGLFARWFLRCAVHGVHLARYEGWWLPGDGRHGGREAGPAGGTPDEGRSDPQEMLVRSARATARWWRGRYGEPIDVEALLAAPPLDSAEFSVRLHTNAVTGPAPLCGVAVVHEAGHLLMTIGPALLENSRRVFGADSVCCGFLADRIERHGDHLGSVRRRLESCLADRPDALGQATDAGKASLAGFAAFMTECWDLAEADLE